MNSLQKMCVAKSCDEVDLSIPHQNQMEIMAAAVTAKLKYGIVDVEAFVGVVGGKRLYCPHDSLSDYGAEQVPLQGNSCEQDEQRVSGFSVTRMLLASPHISHNVTHSD